MQEKTANVKMFRPILKTSRHPTNMSNVKRKMFCPVIAHNRVLTRAGTLLWVYCQYIAMPYIALARQAWIYRDISDSLGTLLWIKNELWSVLQHITLCGLLQCFSEFLYCLWLQNHFYNVLISFFPTLFGHFRFHPTLALTCAHILTLCLN